MSTTIHPPPRGRKASAEVFPLPPGRATSSNARADFEYQRVERRRKDAPRYWMLGKVLRVVRADFTLTQWTTWRDAHSIDRTRAGRAILLARAFRSAKKIRGLPLLTALALAREILDLPERRSTADARLRRSLSAMKKSLQERLDEFDAVTSTDGLRQCIAEIRQKLTAIDHACIAREKARRSPSPTGRGRG